MIRKSRAVNLEQAKEPVIYEGRLLWLFSPEEFRLVREALKEGRLGFGVSYLPMFGLNLIVGIKDEIFLRAPVNSPEVREALLKGSFILGEDKEENADGIEVNFEAFLDGYVRALIDVSEALEREALNIAQRFRNSSQGFDTIGRGGQN